MWQALSKRLEAEDVRVREHFDKAIHQHHRQVTQEIQQAATQLHDELQKHPGRLNTLRTARATIDLGSLLLLIKTGGLTPLDAVWAPAAFSLTSLLMEGVAGLEMKRIDHALRGRQVEYVETGLVENTLVRGLHDLAENLEDGGLFGISATDLTAARAALDAWEKGDE